MKRRDFLKFGVAAAASLAGSRVEASNLAKPAGTASTGFCFANRSTLDLSAKPSPPSTPFVAPLKRPVIKQAGPQRLDPPPEPKAHQRYNQFVPRKFYEVHEQEFKWQYHPEPPYDKGSWSWGFDGTTPGPSFYIRCGEPVLVRIFNDLPAIGRSNLRFALPSTSTHLHGAHLASESGGYHTDFIDPGEFWDHHYPNFPMGHDKRGELTTLWYHDRRLDFAEANLLAGLAGFYLLFDDEDSGNENDPNPLAFRLPSGKYDLPLLLQDMKFDETGQIAFAAPNSGGMLGDKYSVNRILQPYCTVEARKYRLRILNAGPSRFYQLFLASARRQDVTHAFAVITEDGNFLPAPIQAESIYLAVGQRTEVVVDFSRFKAGEQLFLQNRLEQTSVQGPNGKVLEMGDTIMRFDVVENKAPDHSRVPEQFRKVPDVITTNVNHQRIWKFDDQDGQSTINGKIFDPKRSDAKIRNGSEEIWSLLNTSRTRSYALQFDLAEFLLLEVNGRPIVKNSMLADRQKPLSVFVRGRRCDAIALLPNDHVKLYAKFRDFRGKYLMQCLNADHQRVAVRWDVL